MAFTVQYTIQRISYAFALWSVTCVYKFLQTQTTQTPSCCLTKHICLEKKNRVPAPYMSLQSLHLVFWAMDCVYIFASNRSGTRQKLDSPTFIHCKEIWAEVSITFPAKGLGGKKGRRKSCDKLARTATATTAPATLLSPMFHIPCPAKTNSIH